VLYYAALQEALPVPEKKEKPLTAKERRREKDAQRRAAMMEKWRRREMESAAGEQGEGGRGPGEPEGKNEPRGDRTDGRGGGR
jgi:hypothetical protein